MNKLALGTVQFGLNYGVSNFSGQTNLSEASKISLKVQGGIFSKQEAEEFINKPQMKEAVEMRRLDDQAKILNKKTPSVEHFRKYVENSFQANS